MPKQSFVPPPPPGFALEGSAGAASGGGAGVPDAARTAAISKLAAARLLERQLAETKRVYQATQKKPGLGNQIREYFPSRENGQFDKAIDQLKPLALPFFRAPGEGAATEGDAARFEAPLPSRYSLDSTNDQAFSQLERLVGDTKATYAPIAGQVEEGTTIVNRQTGQRMVLKGGKWQGL